MFIGRRQNSLIRLKGIGESSVFCTSHILSVVEIENIRIELLLHVVPDEAMTHDIVVGRDFILQDVSENFNRNGLSIVRENFVQACESSEVNFDTIDTNSGSVDKDNSLRC